MKKIFLTKYATIKRKYFCLLLIFVVGVIGGFLFFVVSSKSKFESKKKEGEELLPLQQQSVTITEVDKQTEKPQWVDEIIRYMPAFKYSINLGDREELQDSLLGFYNKYELIGTGGYRYSKWSSDFLSYLEEIPSLKDLTKEERSKLFNNVLIESYINIDRKNINKYVETADYLGYLDQGDKNRLKSVLSNRILQYIDLLYRNKRTTFDATGHENIAALRDKNHWLQSIESVTKEEYLKFLTEDKRRLIIDFINSYIEKFQ